MNKTSSSISDATFSCDGLLVYASFMNGTVCIFMAEDLQIRCRISPGAYLPPGERYSNKTDSFGMLICLFHLILAMNQHHMMVSFLYIALVSRIFRSKIYPVVVAANPEKPNQFGVGLSVGGVIVFEPLETEEQWGLPRSH